MFFMNICVSSPVARQKVYTYNENAIKIHEDELSTMTFFCFCFSDFIEKMFWPNSYPNWKVVLAPLVG